MQGILFIYKPKTWTNVVTETNLTVFLVALAGGVNPPTLVALFPTTGSV